MKRIKSDKIIVGEELFDGYVYFENGQITEVTTKNVECETFDFSGNTVKIQIKGTPSFPEFILKNATSPGFVRNNKVIKAIVTRVVGALVSTTEMPMRFKCK